MARRKQNGGESGGKIKNWSRVKSRERKATLQARQKSYNHAVHWWSHDYADSSVRLELVGAKRDRRGRRLPGSYEVVVEQDGDFERIRDGGDPFSSIEDAEKIAVAWMRKNPCG